MITITDEQIKQLRDEATNAGDDEQVEICDRALTRDDDLLDQDGHSIPLSDWTQDEARAECERVIAEAAALALEDRTRLRVVGPDGQVARVRGEPAARRLAAEWLGVWDPDDLDETATETGWQLWAPDAAEDSACVTVKVL